MRACVCIRHAIDMTRQEACRRTLRERYVPKFLLGYVGIPRAFTSFLSSLVFSVFLYALRARRSRESSFTGRHHARYNTARGVERSLGYGVGHGGCVYLGCRLIKPGVLRALRAPRSPAKYLTRIMRAHVRLNAFTRINMPVLCTRAVRCTNET